eukprot:TRINITY_DN3315_c0_g4_i2.p1 TRINITY_DN3315_c0_g4~~TRINITY_DN3315_c0_g4_i2.p1  ORF type:complete len:550 (-),score=43.66 TRINITY_DN3315_c0_g4_i2:91-1740(-)
MTSMTPLPFWSVLAVKRAVAPFLIEFMGSFLVVLVLCLQLEAGELTWGPTAVGAAVVVAMYCASAVSGGLVNPVVTVVFWLCGRLQWSCTIGYVIVQCSAGALAGCTASKLRAGMQTPGGNMGIYSLAPVFQPSRGLASGSSGFILEVLYTSVIGFVALNCMSPTTCTSKRSGNQFFALAVGFVSVAGGHAVAGISPCLFNPAATLGILAQGLCELNWAIIFLGCQLIGALVAATLYGTLRMRSAGFDGGSNLATRLMSEMIGTFIVGLTVLLSRYRTLQDVHEIKLLQDVFQVAPGTDTAQGWAYGTMTMCMIYSLCEVSNAHFNPAVTLAMMCTGRDVCRFGDGVLYIASQAVAGLVAGVVSEFFLRDGAHVDQIQLGPQEGYTWAAAALVESSFTTGLVLVVLCTTTMGAPQYPKAFHPSRSFNYGLAIGMLLAAGAYSSEKITGGELNPAMTLASYASRVARATSTALEKDGSTLFGALYATLARLWRVAAPFGIIAALQLGGGFLAAVFFRLLHPLLYKPDPLLAAPAPATLTSSSRNELEHGP